jgi:hypothetical protein
MRDIPDKCTENQNKHFIFKSFLSKNHVVSDIMWENVVEPDRPQMTTWHMHFAYWIKGYRHTLRTCNTSRFLQQ